MACRVCVIYCDFPLICWKNFSERCFPADARGQPLLGYEAGNARTLPRTKAPEIAANARFMLPDPCTASSCHLRPPQPHSCSDVATYAASLSAAQPLIISAVQIHREQAPKLCNLRVSDLTGKAAKQRCKPPRDKLCCLPDQKSSRFAFCERCFPYSLIF